MSKEILSPGKKLKKIRKELKIKQHEITGSQITRELISIIENEKCNLTPFVAELLSNNINKICADRGISFHITREYLMEDISTQVNKTIDEYICYLNDNSNYESENFTDVLKEIELFLMKYDDISEKKMIIYEKIGDIMKAKHLFNKSYTYYIKAYENHSMNFNDLKLFSLIQKIGSICIILRRYKEALDFNDLALSSNEDLPKNLEYNIHFNNTLCYIYLKEHDAALMEINDILDRFSFLQTQDLFELNALKANCQINKKLYNAALDTNYNLLNTLAENDYENHWFIMENILLIYSEMKDYTNIKHFINKMIMLLNKYDDVEKSYHTPNCYRQLGISYSLINNIGLSKKYYKKSINISKKLNNIDILEKSLNEFLDIIIQDEDIKEINIFKDELKEFIRLGLINRNSMLIFKLISFYNYTGNKKSIQDIIDYVINAA